MPEQKHDEQKLQHFFAIHFFRGFSQAEKTPQRKQIFYDNVQRNGCSVKFKLQQLPTILVGWQDGCLAV